MNNCIDLLVEKEDSKIRIDKYITDNVTDLTRSYIQKLIEDGLVLVNGKQIKSNYKVSEGEQITVEIPPPIDLNIEPEEIPLDIIYEDKDIIIINKGKGMVVHPAAGHYSGTLVNGLLYHGAPRSCAISATRLPTSGG